MLSVCCVWVLIFPGNNSTTHKNASCLGGKSTIILIELYDVLYQEYTYRAWCHLPILHSSVCVKCILLVVFFNE